jgi:signal transduction histidine kinase
MQLSFRRRLFLAMVGLGTVPLAVALGVLALQVRSAGSPAGPRAALDEIAESGGRVMAAVDSTALSPAGREALQTHAEVITRRTTLARRAEALSRYAAGALAATILAVAVIVIIASLGLARRWSRLVSAPIEELVAWVRRVERREPLPAGAPSRGVPEFDALRVALRDMSAALDRARRRELEQERLTAFRETARTVAHEMRGPLTASRLALRQLAGESPGPAVTVLEEETRRLERMAGEFSDFGRLPEGPESEVDLTELISGAVTATVPAARTTRTNVQPGVTVTGRYEPLRRAIQNVLRNAVEASEKGEIAIEVRRSGGFALVTITDTGPGVPSDLRERIFDPYVTTKKAGTGLGLALVRQTMAAHGGTVEVRDGPTGGAAFVLSLPEGA